MAPFLALCALLTCAIAPQAYASHRHRQASPARHGAHAPLPPPDNVSLIIVGFRHGNRNPGQFFKNDTSHQRWAWEGPSQLTNTGRTQAFTLGEFLRRRYKEDLVKGEFIPGEVKAYSSSAERCQQTLQSVMAGFYPPKGRSQWSQRLNWQPVPYEINDPLLRMYNIHCPTYKAAYGGIADDSIDVAKTWLTRIKPVVVYIARNTGFNWSLSDLGDVADNIGNMLGAGHMLTRS